MPAPADPVGFSGDLVELATRARSGEEWRNAPFREAAAALQSVQPGDIASDAGRMAFWINVYNALVIDAVRSLEVQTSIREHNGFFHRAAYDIGGLVYTLDQVENGLLLGNRPLHRRLPPPFEDGDPRLQAAPGRVDSRVHFALNCATRSCPLIKPYDADSLAGELDAAARHFINHGGVQRDESGEGVVLSAIFWFYAVDFGGPEGVTGWILPYLHRQALREALQRGPVRFEDYDWTLPGGAAT